MTELPRVLVVDDNRINIKTIAEALRDSCKIMAATNWEQALRAVRGTSPPDLILLDVVLPDVDGFEIIRLLKEDTTSRDVPVIFITSMDGDADEARGLAAGAVDYIVKPIVPAIVRARVKTQLELRRNVEALQSAYVALADQKALMDQELKVAQELQRSLQPQLPASDGFRVAGAMRPARAVSGDFYDAFFVDADHVCFTIGDVSGKGVPAALFMSMSRMLVRGKADRTLSTARIVTDVNRVLLEGNDACMFVTLVVAMLDLRTGQVTYSNAGHTPPFVVSTGGVSKLTARHGPAVGIQDVAYREDTVQLVQGDSILLYTDGVTEARNSELDLFGETRLTAWLEYHTQESPRNLVQAMVAEVEAFEHDMVQADDLTLLSVEYSGPATRSACDSHELSLSSRDLDERHLSEHIETFLRSIGLVDHIHQSLYLLLEELVSNIVDHGYPGVASNIDIGVRMELVEDAIIVHISDSGIAFNPLEAPPPRTDTDLAARRVGGLGIHLCRQLADEIQYERKALRNNLRLVKRVDLRGVLRPAPSGHDS